MPDVQHKRGTRADLNTLRDASGLLVGQIYLISDEDRIAIATATNAYEVYAKVSEVYSGTITAGSVEPSLPANGDIWLDTSGA